MRSKNILARFFGIKDIVGRLEHEIYYLSFHDDASRHWIAQQDAVITSDPGTQTFTNVLVPADSICPHTLAPMYVEFRRH